MRTLAVVNQKGGVGKTTATIHLAAALSERGERVVVVDLDPQGHATEGLGLVEYYDRTDVPTLAAGMVGEWVGDPDELVVEGPEGIGVIPSTVDQFLVEARLVAMRGREYRLQSVLRGLTGDWCLIDCPPSLGALTDNAVIAAGEVLIVAQPQGPSLRALELLLDQLDTIRDGLHVPIRVAGIVLNLCEDTTVAKRFEVGLGKLPIPVLARIRRRVKIQEAWEEGRTVLSADPNGHVAVAFRVLADTLIADGAEVGR